VFEKEEKDPETMTLDPLAMEEEETTGSVNLLADQEKIRRRQE
jgi:hypothetical protein